MVYGHREASFAWLAPLSSMLQVDTLRCTRIVLLVAPLLCVYVLTTPRLHRNHPQIDANREAIRNLHRQAEQDTQRQLQAAQAAAQVGPRRRGAAVLHVGLGADTCLPRAFVAKAASTRRMGHGPGDWHCSWRAQPNSAAPVAWAMEQGRQQSLLMAASTTDRYTHARVRKGQWCTVVPFQGQG